MRPSFLSHLLVPSLLGSEALGFDPIDVGVLTRARELEHVAALWIALAYGATGAPALGRNFAFRLVRR